MSQPAGNPPCRIAANRISQHASPLRHAAYPDLDACEPDVLLDSYVVYLPSGMGPSKAITPLTAGE